MSEYHARIMPLHQAWSVSILSSLGTTRSKNLPSTRCKTSSTQRTLSGSSGGYDSSETWRTGQGSSRQRRSSGRTGLSISPATYCHPSAMDIPPLPEAVAAFKQALAEARAAEERLQSVLVEDGWLE